MPITDKGMNARPAPADQWLRESLGRGCGVFEARITPGGARLFYYRYSDPAGDRIRMQVGTYSKDGAGGGMTLLSARKRASEWSLLYQGGARDLRGHFEREREAREAAERRDRLRRDEDQRAAEAAALATSRRLTVRELFVRWKSTELAPGVGTDGKRTGRKDGGKYIEDQFERRLFPKLGDVAAADIRKTDLMAALDGVVGEGKRRTANVLLASLKQMFRFALAREIVDRSPLDTITKRDVGGAETSRDRVLSGAEVTTLAKALPSANMGARSVFAIWLILATGCRVSEAMGALWEHLDVAGRTWLLPETKNERDHTIHLSDFALRQFDGLESLRERRMDGTLTPWVFPNRKGDGPVDIKTFGKQLADRQRTADRRMKGRAKQTGALTLPGGRWTSHDLRRTAATVMAELGVSGDVIDECLNHVIESRVRRTYIRDRRRVDQALAFDALGARLAVLVEGAAKPKVVRLPTPRTGMRPRNHMG